MIQHKNDNGSVNVSTNVYTDIAGTAASNCFGVKGMAARSVTDGLYHLLRKESVGKGVKVEFHEDNTISIDVGMAWMHLSRFNGAAVALKSKTFVDMGLPNATYPRIDALVLQFDANKNGAELVSKQGTASSNPQPPAVSRTEALYELHLLHVLRSPGAPSITAADVTDLRLNEKYCGLMADSVTRVDTVAIDAQVTALIQKLREDLQAVQDQTYYASKDYVKTQSQNMTLRSSAWSGSGPYVQTITISDLTDDRKPMVYLNTPEDSSQEAALLEESAKIASCRRSGNQLTFRCLEEAPAVDIPVVVEVYV